MSATDDDKKSFLNTFPYVTAWATIANIMLVSTVVIVVTIGFYMKESSHDFKPTLKTIHEIGQLFALAFRHREYYQGNHETIARGAKYVFEFSDRKKELLDAKKAYYEELFKSGLKTLYGWQTYGNNRYYISKGRKTWFDAQKFCTDRNSHLASIHSAAEQKFITSQLRQPSWIGLTDEDEEGRWKWSDDSWFTIQYWADGQPSKAEGRQGLEQDCTSIVPSASEYNWKDDRCDQLRHWVCKQFRG